jgi:hypothetical protein
LLMGEAKKNIIVVKNTIAKLKEEKDEGEV